MNKKIILLSAIIFGTATSIFAQDEIDALRLSQTNYFGTARAMGIGSAVGSLGGDFTSLSVNPAGLGMYRRSEFTITPDFSVQKNGGTYLNETTNAQDSKFNLAEMGVVLTRNKSNNNYGRKSGWKTSSFAFGVNRLANFNSEIAYSGKNFSSSIVQKWANDFNALGGLNSTTLNHVNYSAYGAYQTYLIDKDYANDSTKAASYVPFADGLQQTKQVYQKGGINELVVSGGGNYMEKLLIGVTLGIPMVNYDRTLNYSESDLSRKTNNDFSYLKYTETLSTTGTGINLKIGAIIKPNDNFRLGLAFHTPTSYSLVDASSISITSNTDSLLIKNNPSASAVTYYEQDTAQAFNYTFVTPYKAIGSATILFKKSGFISADVEYVDYSTMKYKYGTEFQAESNLINTTIQNTYKSTFNVRLGGELKIKDYALRAGYAYYGSPYKNSTVNADQMQMSIGGGYRGKNWFADIAFVNATKKYNEKPYTLASNLNNNVATIKNNMSQFVFTIGFKL